MSRIPPHTARIVSAWPQPTSRPRSRRHPVKVARHAVAVGLVAVARSLHLLHTPAPPPVTGHVGRHA